MEKGPLRVRAGCEDGFSLISREDRWSPVETQVAEMRRLESEPPVLPWRWTTGSPALSRGMVWDGAGQEDVNRNARERIRSLEEGITLDFSDAIGICGFSRRDE